MENSCCRVVKIFTSWHSFPRFQLLKELLLVDRCTGEDQSPSKQFLLLLELLDDLHQVRGAGFVGVALRLHLENPFLIVLNDLLQRIIILFGDDIRVNAILDLLRIHPESQSADCLLDLAKRRVHVQNDGRS